WEWCWDWYDSGYYAKSPGPDPRGAGSGSYRGLRGGAWYNYGSHCRVANRYNNIPDNGDYSNGLRLARAVF
nr:SUMF1/EgtB/PvdO family nonheme iron enzyme [Candidatus Cloacimonadota bacterium]